MPALYQMFYRSNCRRERIDNLLQTLRDIVRSSSRNNRASGITGYLLFDGETFLQILEGDREAVALTYERIEADARHRDAQTLLTREIEQRQLPEWSMGGTCRPYPSRRPCREKMPSVWPLNAKHRVRQ